MSKLPHDDIKRWIENGMSMSAVAKKLNKNVGSISNFCKKHNIKSKYSSDPTDVPMDEIYKLYVDGVSCYKLGKKFGIPPSTIKKKLLNNYPDLNIRSMDEAKRPPILNDHEKLSNKMKVMSIRSIASELGVKIKTVSDAAKRLGLSDLIRDQTITDKPEDLKLLYENGATLTDIANTYNTYPTTIANIIRRVGGEIRSCGVLRESKYDELNDKEWLIHQYHTNDRSMAFIALYLGTSVGNVSHALEKHNIAKKSKKKVYSKLRRNNAKKTSVTTKWGTFRLQSNAELDFVNSLSPEHKIVKYEPEVFSYGGSDYAVDFYVDGDYYEIKPLGYSVKPGVDRQKFIKQVLIAKNNNIDIKLWYKGKTHEYNEIEDIDRYFCMNWKLLFNNYEECYEFLIKYGFKAIKWNYDSLLCGLNAIHTIPENNWLNANYPKQSVVNFIRHFNDHYWYSSHKDYLSITDAFREGNRIVLKRSLKWLWDKKRGFNIYGLFKLIAKMNKDFAVVSIFKPWVAKYVYNKLLPDGGTVIDPCMGWGGRFLGTVGYDIKYIGYDFNTNAIKSHSNMASFVGSASMHEPVFNHADSSIIDWPDGDLLFTSPPYDDTEYYHGLKEQCKDTSSIYNNIMKFNGTIALNVPKRHKDKCVDIANKHDRKLVDEYKMRTRNFMGVRESTFEPILIFK